jgi:muramidase (phage lysozyme)
MTSNSKKVAKTSVAKTAAKTSRASKTSKSKTSKTSKTNKSAKTDKTAKVETCPLLKTEAISEEEPSGLWWYLISGSAVLLIAMLTGGLHGFLKGVPLWDMLPSIAHFELPSLMEPRWNGKPLPLVMEGGEPHIRALMRTISASEASGNRPYSLLYGGEHIANLSQHPDRCVRIVAGPNLGNCTTAAGRYQMLSTTWQEQSQKYHPKPPFFFWDGYNFAPEYQDKVVYRWLNDPSAWGADLSQMLKEGHITEVLRILSPTWTSLGYGIETNSVSNDLPEIYQQMLQEELVISRK